MVTLAANGLPCDLRALEEAHDEQSARGNVWPWDWPSETARENKSSDRPSAIRPRCSVTRRRFGQIHVDDTAYEYSCGTLTLDAADGLLEGWPDGPKGVGLLVEVKLLADLLLQLRDHRHQVELQL